MSDTPEIEIEGSPADFTSLADQLRANPADGPVRLSAGENGSVVAEWESNGRTTRFGPSFSGPEVEAAAAPPGPA